MDWLVLTHNQLEMMSDKSSSASHLSKTISSLSPQCTILLKVDHLWNFLEKQAHFLSCWWECPTRQTLISQYHSFNNSAFHEILPFM